MHGFEEGWRRLDTIGELSDRGVAVELRFIGQEGESEVEFTLKAGVVDDRAIQHERLQVAR